MVFTAYYGLKMTCQVGAAVFEAAYNHATREGRQLTKNLTGFSVIENKDESVFGHCLAFPPGWGELATHYDPVNIIDYWIKNKPVFTEDVEYLTIGEYIALRLLDVNSFLPLPRGSIITYMENTFKACGALYKTGHNGMKIKWTSLVLAATEVGHSFSNNDISGIQSYNTLVNKLCKLPGETRAYISHVCQLFFNGDVENLATSVDQKNIRYVMQKFKLANTIPLLQQLFSSPTWKGKLTAIERLIELFDIDLFQVSSEALAVISEYILRISIWIMEKTKAGAEFIKNKCGWVSAEEKEEWVEMQAAPNDLLTCKCKKETTKGCSMCGLHTCESCPSCKCPNYYNHLISSCDCGNNQDCLFRALAPQLQQTVPEIKRTLFAATTYAPYEEMHKNLVKAYQLEDINIPYGEIIETIRSELAVNEQAGFDTIQMVCFAYDRNVQIISEEGVRQFELDPKLEWIYLRYFGYHYEISEAKVELPTHFLWGSTFNSFSHAPSLGKSRAVRKINMAPKAQVKIQTPPNEPAKEEILLSPPINPTVSVTVENVCQLLADMSDTESDTSSEGSYVERLSEVVSSAHCQQVESSGVTYNAKTEEVVLPTIVKEMDTWGLTGITDKIKDWFKNTSKDIIQWFDDSPFIAGIIAIVLGVAQFLGFYVAFPTTKSGFAGVMEKFNNSTRTMHYARSGFKGILESIKDCFSCCRGMLGIAENKELNDFKEDLAKALETCREMLVTAQSKPSVFVNDVEGYQSFKKQYTSLVGVYTRLIKFADARDTAILNPIWFALSKTFENLTHIYTKFVNGMNSRIVPVCIYLYGGTNIGKSAVLSHLSNMLNLKLGTSMSSYTISKGNAYWNNFGGHQIIRMDDLNAFVSPAEGDIDSLNLFNLITDAPFIPPQAAIPDKGVMAAPYFVLCASNNPTVPSNTCIADVRAWERRRHLCVHVSWPDHQRDCGETTDCVHFKNKKLDNFDHLTFTIVDPVMSNSKISSSKIKNIKTGCEYSARVVQTTDAKEILAHGQRKSLNEIVDMACELHQLHKSNYEVALKAAIEAGTMKMQTKHWAANPIVALEGIPGTGKSTIMSRLADKDPARTLRIVKLEQWQLFAKGEYKAPNKKYVIIDDLTTLVEDKECWSQYVKFVHELYNSQKPPPYLVIVGVNQTILEEKTSQDQYEQIMRRCEIIRCFFKKKDFKDQAINLFKSRKFNLTYYRAEDIKARAKDENFCVDNYVEYYHGEDKLLQELVVSRILQYSPEVVEVDYQNEMGKRKKVDATCIVRLGMSISELTSFINQTSMSALANLIQNSDIKTYGKSKLTLMKLGTNIKKIVNSCKNFTGTRFDSFDEVLLLACNQKFLTPFKDECIVLVLKDRIFYVDCVGNNEVGELDCAREELKNVIDSLQEVSNAANIDKIKSIVATMYPPWFTLSLDIFSTILKIITPTVSAILSVQDQNELYRSYRAWSPTEKMISAGTEAVFNYAHNRAAEKLGVKELKIEREKYYPGLAHPKVPQYSFADESPSEIFGSDVGKETELRSTTRVNPNAHWQTHTTTATKSPPTKWETELRSTTRVGPKTTWAERSQVPSLTRNTVTEEIISDEYCDRPYDIRTSMSGPIPETAEVVQFHSSAPAKKIEAVVQQMTTDPSLYSIVNSIIKNFAEIVDITGHRLCSGLFVRGKTIRTVAHITETNDPDKLFVKTLDGKVYPTKVIFKSEIYDRLDLMITDPRFESRQDISHHFPSKSNLIAEGKYAVLITPNTNLLKEGVTFYIRSYMIKDYKYKVFANLNKTYYIIDYRGHKAGYMLDGPVQTTFGDCGSVLVLADPNASHGKVMGIHIAGTPTAAYASPFFKEQYDDKIQFQSVESYAKVPKALFPLPTDYEHGVAATDLKIFVPSKTKLFRNWFPLGEQVYEPSVLDSRDTRSTVPSVLVQETAKWCKERRPLSLGVQQELHDCMIEIATHFADVMRGEGITLRKLTSMEALNKYSKSSHSEPINIHTSPGFPWNVGNNCPGKTKFITCDANGIRRFNSAEQVAVSKLQGEVNKYLDLSQRQGGKMAIFQVFLKDECVKLKKVYEATKTRTIAAAPLDYQIAYRKMIHPAQCAIMDCWHLLPIKIGINALSLDWHTLFMSLAKVNMQAVDLDYKGWDFSTPPFIIGLLPIFYDVLYKNLDPEYTETDNEIRESLYSHIKEFYLLLGKTLCRSTGGIPSGYPGTSYDNSIINLLITYWAFKQVAKKSNPKLNNYYSFRELIAPAIYGDDIVMTVHGDVLQSFNGVTIPGIVKELGYDAQPADKTDVFIAHRPLKDCIFLSRGFRYVSGFWIGPLLVDHLFKPSWFVSDRRSHFFWLTPDEMCRSADIVAASYESMLYEAALHGDDVFNLVREAALNVYKRAPINYPVTKREALQRIFGESIDYKVVDGLSFHKCDDIIEGFSPLGRPPNNVKFHNRTSYSYGPDYFYNGNTVKSNKIPKKLKVILDKINLKFSKNFNSILVNEYPPGGEIPWHKDNETSLDLDHGVLGLTIMGDGVIEFKDQYKVTSFFLEPGTAYLMEKDTLEKYQHRRIRHKYTTVSYTFRKIDSST